MSEKTATEVGEAILMLLQHYKEQLTWNSTTEAEVRKSREALSLEQEINNRLRADNQELHVKLIRANERCDSYREARDEADSQTQKLLQRVKELETQLKAKQGTK